MAKRTRIFPRDLSDPEPLKDHQVSGLKKVLEGFRHLYQLLDDVLPTGDSKDAAIAALVSAKRLSDEAVRHHQPRLTMKRLSELYLPVELMDDRVDKVVVNVHTFADMRVDPSITPCFDVETRRELLMTGLMGVILNASLYVSRSVPVGKVVVISERDNIEIKEGWSPAPDQLEDI